MSEPNPADAAGRDEPSPSSSPSSPPWAAAFEGAFLEAASAARIGMSVVTLEPGDSRIVYMTDVGAEILGHSKETLLNLPAASFLTPASREEQSARPPPAAQPGGGGRSFELTIATADGREVPLELSTAEISLRGRPALVVFFRDISARRNAIAAQRKSEERFRKLIEMAPDAIWINDGQRLVYANSATVRLLGYDNVEQVLALDPRKFVHPDDQLAMRERSSQMSASGDPMAPREYRVLRRDGAWILTEVHSMPIEWEGKNGILGFARDVSARKQTEARLMRSERLAALGTLLAGIAHEMNNPLTFALLGIEQATALLQEPALFGDGRPGGRSDGPERLRVILADVGHGIDRVAAVVRQLRVSSRPDVEQRAQVDLRAVIESALRVAQNEIRHRAHLSAELADVGPVSGSPQQLEQVFLNLLLNATQALPEGRADNQIRVTLRLESNEAVVAEVWDNGVGIAPSLLRRVFDPFFTTKPVGLGMGLGLSICHGIVTSHGGTIGVDSEPEQGTTFRLTLPLAQPRTAATPAPDVAAISLPADDPGPERPRRVLVVDDEALLCRMVRRMLHARFEVTLALDAREALSRLDADPAGFDVILCDLMMPEMTGMDLYDAVVSRHPDCAKRFVFMTGGAFTPRATEFLAKLSAPLLEKPFDARSLQSALDLCPPDRPVVVADPA
jgi:PAS domain S-box-containing protein